jgi:non-ribosomal peptide synthetase component E (peptide arylation enzyme)
MDKGLARAARAGLGPHEDAVNHAPNLGNLLTETARRHPDAIGLVLGERSWAWAALERLGTEVMPRVARSGG